MKRAMGQIRKRKKKGSEAGSLLSMKQAIVQIGIDAEGSLDQWRWGEVRSRKREMGMDGEEESLYIQASNGVNE